jgi:hypothetical protein
MGLFHFELFFHYNLDNIRSGPTEWLRGSGGTGETPTQLLHILANRTCAERQSRCLPVPYNFGAPGSPAPVLWGSWCSADNLFPELPPFLYICCACTFAQLLKVEGRNHLFAGTSSLKKAGRRSDGDPGAFYSFIV